MFRNPHLSGPILKPKFQPEEFFHKSFLENEQRKIDTMEALRRKGDIKSMLHLSLMKAGILLR
jgi:hypothetical protein